MLVPFDELPGSSRIWIYQSNKILSANEINTIGEIAEKFLSQWAAHGSALKSAYKILHNKFLVISVDESFHQASGCSIDASVSMIRTIQQELQIDFFDRTKVCFENNGQIFEAAMTDLKELINLGKVTSDTVTFNNLVQNIEEFENNWMVPANQSWLKRYF